MLFMRDCLLTFIILTLLFISPNVSAQRDTAAERKILDSLVKGYEFQNIDTLGHQFVAVQLPPNFRNGIKGWTDYVSKNLNADIAGKYVKMKKTDSMVRQTIIVTFTVDPTGLISDVKAEPPAKGMQQHPKIAAEAVRVIAEGPRWEPATHELFEVVNGKVPYEAIVEKKKKGFKKVLYRHKQSITFIVTQD
jgi:hypothetical protein